MELRVVSSGSKGNCYVLDSGKEILLLDCGVRFEDIVRGCKYDIRNVSGLLLTHIHGDHTKSYQRFVDAYINVYGCPELADDLQKRDGRIIQRIFDRSSIRIGEFTVSPFYLPHTTMNKETNELEDCKNYGYLIQHQDMGKLLYLTDFEYCKFRFNKLNVNHILVECNYIPELLNMDMANKDHVLSGHCSINTCIKVIEEAKTDDLRNVMAIHLGGSIKDDSVVRSRIKQVVGNNTNVYIANKGVALELNKYPF